MLEDRLLVWKLNRGSIEALSRIYEKYKDDLLRLATALSNMVPNHTKVQSLTPRVGITILLGQRNTA